MSISPFHAAGAHRFSVTTAGGVTRDNVQRFRAQDIRAILFTFVVELASIALVLMIHPSPGFQFRAPTTRGSMCVAGPASLIAVDGQNKLDEFCLNLSDQPVHSYIVRRIAGPRLYFPGVQKTAFNVRWVSWDPLAASGRAQRSTPESLNRLVACTADDPRVIAICGGTLLSNEEGSWWTVILHLAPLATSQRTQSDKVLSCISYVDFIPRNFYPLSQDRPLRPLRELSAYHPGAIDTLPYRS